MSFILSQSPVVWPLVAAAFFGGYLSGSVPFGLILTRIAGIGDIRNSGSGNIGATNVLRTGGKKLAAATLLLDMFKGFVPVIIARQFHADYAVLAALGALAGHVFPVWLSFRGGKGVATGLGICFALLPLLGVALVAIWLLVAVVSRYSSLSALVAFGAAPILTARIAGDYQLIATVFIIATVIWFKHHENIGRLIQGTEGKINAGKK